MNKAEELFYDAVCNTIDAMREEGCDYTLAEVACWVGNCQIVGETLVSVSSAALQMDGSAWVEPGHQYSTYKQWWPLHPDLLTLGGM